MIFEAILSVKILIFNNLTILSEINQIIQTPQVSFGRNYALVFDAQKQGALYYDFSLLSEKNLYFFQAKAISHSTTASAIHAHKGNAALSPEA